MIILGARVTRITELDQKSYPNSFGVSSVSALKCWFPTLWDRNTDLETIVLTMIPLEEQDAALVIDLEPSVYPLKAIIASVHVKGSLYYFIQHYVMSDFC